MGADFLVSCLIAPAPDIKDVKLDLTGALKHIDHTDWSKDNAVIDQLHHLLDHRLQRAKRKQSFNRIIRERLKAAVSELRELTQWRDVNWVWHKGEILFLSGGLSWGDAPTDRYSTFNLILAAGLEEVLMAKMQGKRGAA